MLLLTDGDWNVGITDEAELTKLIQEKAAQGVSSVLGLTWRAAGTGGWRRWPTRTGTMRSSIR